MRPRSIGEIMDFDAILRWVETTIAVVGDGTDVRDALHDRVIASGASEETFFFAWVAARTGRSE